MTKNTASECLSMETHLSTIKYLHVAHDILVNKVAKDQWDTVIQK